MNQIQITEKIFELIAMAWTADAPHMTPKEELLRAQAATWAQELKEVEFTEMDSSEFDWLFSRCRKLMARKGGGNPVPSLALFQAERFSNEVREQMSVRRKETTKLAKIPSEPTTPTAKHLKSVEMDLIAFESALILSRESVTKFRAIHFVANARGFLRDGGQKSLIDDLLRKFSFDEAALSMIQGWDDVPDL